MTLVGDKSIVFKIADKGLSVVLLDRFNYIRQIKIIIIMKEQKNLRVLLFTRILIKMKQFFLSCLKQVINILNNTVRMVTFLTRN